MVAGLSVWMDACRSHNQSLLTSDAVSALLGLVCAPLVFVGFAWLAWHSGLDAQDMMLLRLALVGTREHE